MHVDVAEVALRRLMDIGSVDAVALAHASAESGTALRSPPETAPLAPEEALLW